MGQPRPLSFIFRFSPSGIELELGPHGPESAALSTRPPPQPRNAVSLLCCPPPFCLKTWHYMLKRIESASCKKQILHLISIGLILDLSLLQDVVDVVGRGLGPDVRVLPVVRVPGRVVGHFVRLQELLRQNIGHFSSNSSVVFSRPGSTKLYFDLKAFKHLLNKI